MTRNILIAAGLLAISTSAFAQANPEVEKALLAAPRNAARGHHGHQVEGRRHLRHAQGRHQHLVCYDQSGQPTEQPFSVQCTSKANLERVKQNKKFEMEPDRDKRNAAIAAAEKDGTRIKPEFGSVFWTFSGKDEATARRAHDGGGARRDRGHARPARQQQDGRRVDHGGGHQRRPHHGARQLESGRLAGT